MAVRWIVVPLGSVIVGESLGVDVDPAPFVPVLGVETVGTVIVWPAIVRVVEPLPPSPPPQPETRPISPAAVITSAVLSPINSSSA